MIRELEYTQLNRSCKIDNKYTTDRVDMSIVGQETAAEAIRFGLSVKSKGYNIYVAGPNGCGKTSFTERFAREQAAKEKTPDDLCYVYNFKNPISPKLLCLKAGMGKEFKADLEELINRLSVELQNAYTSTEYEDDKERIQKGFQSERERIIKDLSHNAEQCGFGVKFTGNGGVYFLPIVDGKTIDEEEFENLSEEEREEINEGTEDMQELASVALKQIKDGEKKAKKRLEEINYDIALMTIGRFMNPVQLKYSDNPDVSDHLALVKEDLLENAREFTSSDDNGGEDSMMPFMPWMMRKSDEEIFGKYGVNLIVDNSELKGAPVVINYNPSYTNLVGEIEYESENGNFITDFMKIKPGLFHKANGGYLIFHASDILGNAFTWDTVRRVLKTGSVTIEPLKEYQLGGISVAGIQPEKTKIDLKIIVVGSMYYYEMLKQYDDDFSKLFKICSVFDYEMEYSDDNVGAVVDFIHGYTAKRKLLPVSNEATGTALSFCVRLAERQDKISTCFGELSSVLIESDRLARDEGKTEISADILKKAIEKKRERVSIYADKYLSMIYDNDIMIDTEGEVVGQVNGLCVMQGDDYTFGAPTRITASTYIGKAGVVNIEKEAELSGSIHDKGIQVLIGYLGGMYATDFPLTFSSRICFEQSYNGVDGDSASSTETYALLSSLSGLPVKQSLAVTGSMNQFGKIQAIGGVTHKIEGFFKVCKYRGLTGEQGVIIPKANVKDLVLCDEVIEAVKDGKFHIYSVETIDDGAELLLGKKAGKRLKTKGFTKGSIHDLVYKKLNNYYKKSKED